MGLDPPWPGAGALRVAPPARGRQRTSGNSCRQEHVGSVTLEFTRSFFQDAPRDIAMESSSGQPRKTPLYEAHRALGAKMIDFGGWMMPVQYATGIIDEHQATRRAVGLFDVCHMGEVHFRGPRATDAVQRLVTGNVAGLPNDHAAYMVACYPDGGIVDDLIVYRIERDHILIVVNAANVTKDEAWFRDNVGSWCEVDDSSDQPGLLAFQGPLAERALQPLSEAPLGALKHHQFFPIASVAGIPVSIARSGYTAEDGFELFCATAHVPLLWAALLEAATKVGGKPVGLGARDTLRLEGRLSLNLFLIY